jgi:ribosomal protein S18 acetylase RimI-like enzyme
VTEEVAVPRIVPVEVTLRQANLGDFPLLAEYMRGLRQDDPMPPATVASESDTVLAMQRLLSDASLGRVWLIQATDRSVGYAALTFVHSIEFGGRCGFIDELYVAAEFRERGIGRSALKLVVDAVAAEGVRVLLLEVSPENERASGLYRSVGFSERKYRLLVRQISP